MKTARQAVVLLAIAISALVEAPALGGLVIDIGSTQIAPGQTGFVDVLITATELVDNLQAFGVKFQISTVSGRQLWFSSPVTDPQLTNPNYVFASTGSAAMSAPPAGSLSGDFLTYVGLDASNSLAGVSGPFTHLLARLNLTTVTGGFAPQEGDVFTISLVNDTDTAFYNATDPLPVAYSSNSGTVTISAVPEPSSLLLTAAGLGAALFAKRRRRFHETRS